MKEKKTRQTEHDNNREMNMSNITEKSILETLAPKNIAAKILNVFGWNKQVQDYTNYQQNVQNQYQQWMILQQMNRMNQEKCNAYTRNSGPMTSREANNDADDDEKNRGENNFFNVITNDMKKVY